MSTSYILTVDDADRKAVAHDFYLQKGATFRKDITWNLETSNTTDEIPPALTGYIARMQVRARTGELLFELTTENGGITIVDPAGELQLFISAEDTASAPDYRVAKYDLELESLDGDVLRIMEGTFYISPSITR